MLKLRAIGGWLGPRAAAVVLSGVALSFFAAPASAQGGREERPEVDPYTEGEAEALAKAGYERIGTFPYLRDVLTDTIGRDLGGVPLLWVETAHFKLGCSLDAIGLPEERDAKKRAQKELADLRKVLPGLKKPKVLDPWLRMHLYAQRLEALYARFQESFGLEQADFLEGGAFATGPHMGMSGKFCVLLVEKESTLARYTQDTFGFSSRSSFRYFDQQSGAMFLGIAAEFLEGSYATDVALHFAVSFLMTQDLQASFRGYTHQGPLWWRLGVARWFARDVSERVLLFTTPSGTALREGEEDRPWPPRVRARVGHEIYPSLDDMLAWGSYEEMKLPDHMMSWSKVDYLMSLGPKEARKVLVAMQAPVSWDAPDRDAALAARFAEALPEALGQDHASIDAAWAKWVEKEYPKK